MNDPFCDIHTHLLEPPVGEQRRDVLAQARAKGLEFLVSATAKHEQWHETLCIADAKHVFAAIGIHPFHPEDWNDDRARELTSLIQHHPDKIKAVGEIGLDFFDGRDTAPKQRDALAAQLQIAHTHHLPVVLHNRKGWPDFFGLVRDLHITPLHGVCHCFSDSWQIACKCLDLGLHISFAAPVTYSNAHRLRHIAANIPVNRLLAETDTPFMPAHETRRDHSVPEDVAIIIAALARARKIPVSTLAPQLLDNARQLFAIQRT